MTSDSMRQLRQRAESDAELMAAIRGATTKDEIILIASEQGITLDAGDLEPTPSDVALSDAELESAAGGWHPKYGTFTDDCI